MSTSTLTTILPTAGAIRILILSPEAFLRIAGVGRSPPDLGRGRHRGAFRVRAIVAALVGLGAARRSKVEVLAGFGLEPGKPKVTASSREGWRATRGELLVRSASKHDSAGCPGEPASDWRSPDDVCPGCLPPDNPRDLVCPLGLALCQIDLAFGSAARPTGAKTTAATRIQPAWQESESTRKHVEADHPVCQGSGRPGGLPPHVFSASQSTDGSANAG